MPDGYRDAIKNNYLAIGCPTCGHYDEQPMLLLTSVRHVDCQGCGYSIDLSSGETHDEIERIVRVAVREGI